MAWQLTLVVVNANSTSTVLSGAAISKGAVALGNTNAAGQFGPIMLADTETFVILRAHKDSFLDKSGSFNKDAHDGTTQTIALQPSPYGGDDPTVPGEHGGEPLTGGGCFIVSATTGSSQSEEVVRMRALRDRVSAVSRLGEQLIDAIYAEYEQFSPPIAAEIERDELPREAILQAVVRPLLAWYRLAGVLAFGETEAKSAAQDVLDACPEALADVLLPLLQALRDDGPWPTQTPPDLRRLGPILAEFRFVPWAILDALLRAWSIRREGCQPAHEVARWMANAPVELLPRLLGTPLSSELAVLAHFFDFEPAARRQLGARLLTAWPEARALLANAGFV